MTTADEKLCRDLAEAEKWTELEIITSFIKGDVCWGKKTPSSILEPIPDYLTDPAETLRMEKELIGYYKQIAFSKTEDGKIFIMLGDITQEMFELTKHSDHEHAVAEAYLARIRETK